MFVYKARGVMFGSRVSGTGKSAVKNCAYHLPEFLMILSCVAKSTYTNPNLG